MPQELNLDAYVAMFSGVGQGGVNGGKIHGRWPGLEAARCT